jgi:uncharacterized protein
MNEKIKNVQGVAIAVAVVVVAIAVWSYVGSYASSIEPSSFRSFTVSAEGKVVAVPDVASFSFSVVTEGGKDLATLQTTNTGKVNEAIAFLKGKGIEPKDIKTSQYSVEPRYQYYNCANPESSVRPCPPAEIVGYTVTQSVAVKIRDFAIIGDTLSGVVTNGANTVSQLQFTVDDSTTLESEARSEAIAKARAQAEAIARAGGFSVGRLLSIDEGSYPTAYRTAAFDSMEAAYGKGGGSAIAVPAPAVEAGSQDITVTVVLRFEIQ